MQAVLKRPLLTSVQFSNEETLLLNDRAMELPSPQTSVAGMERTRGHCMSKESVSARCWPPLIFNLLKHCVIIAIKRAALCFSLMKPLMFIDNKRRLSLCGFQCPLSPSHSVRQCYSIK